MANLPIPTTRNQHLRAVSTHGEGSDDECGACQIGVQLQFWFLCWSLLLRTFQLNSPDFVRSAISLTRVVTLVFLPLPRYIHQFLLRTGFSIPTARRISSTFSHPLSRTFRCHTIHSGKRHPMPYMQHLQKLLRNREVVFFQPVDVIAVEAGARTTGHDQFSHSMLPVKHQGRRSESSRV